MKKLLTLILALSLILTSFAGVSADSVGLFKGMNVLGELTEKADTDIVTRQEFAYVAATLMGLTVQGPAETGFADVKEDNVYGAAIRAVYDGGIMNGVNSYEFAPESTITIRDAAVVFIRILGYEIWANAKGGYPTGYLQAATSLKLFNKVSSSYESMLTFGDLWAMTDWALDTATAESNFIMQDGSLTEEIKVTKNAPTLLEKNLGITMYEANVLEVMGDTHSIRAVITDEELSSDANHKWGDEITLKASASVNIIAYDKAPVNLWITDDDRLMYIDVQNDCEVVYGTVYSVNRDYNVNASYNTASIEEITLLDDDKEYEISEDGVIFYKNDEVFNGNLGITDKYVRMVTKNDKIVALETWDFKKGGLVSEINFKAITYQRGDVTESISDIENYNKQILILDGENRDIKDLKPGTLVDYYISADKETFILLASEKKYSDVLDSYAGDEIQIGNLLVKADVSNLYVLKDEKGYVRANSISDVAELTGSKVSAYVDATGKIRYITTEEAAADDTFIGYLLGFKTASQGLDKSKEMLIANLEDGTFAQKAYPLSKNISYEPKTGSDMLGEAELIANQDMCGQRQDAIDSAVTDADVTAAKAISVAKSVYRFKVNSNGEIVRVSRLNPYDGYQLDSEGMVTVTKSGEFASYGDPTYMTVNADSKRIYFPKNEPIVVVYDKDGETTFGTITYGALEGDSPAESTVFTFFGEELSSEYDLIIATDGVARMKANSYYGILESVRSAVDEDGNSYKVAVIDGSKYRLSDEDTLYLTSKNYTNNVLVIYTTFTPGFVDYDIDITDSKSLAGSLSTWTDDPSDNGNMELHQGKVVKIDSKRLFVDTDNDGVSDDAFFFSSSGCKYRKVDAADGRITDGNAQDFMENREIVYILSGEKLVTTIFYQD